MAVPELADAGITTLTLTSPETRNALGLLMLDTFIVAFSEIAKDRTTGSSYLQAKARH